MSIWYRVQYSSTSYRDMNPARVLMCHRRRCCWCIDSWYVRRTLVGAGCGSGAGTVADAGGRRWLQLCVAGGSSGETCSGRAAVLVLCLVLELVLVLMRTLVLVLALLASCAARWCWCINRLQRTCFCFLWCVLCWWRRRQLQLCATDAATTVTSSGYALLVLVLAALCAATVRVCVVSVWPVTRLRACVSQSYDVSV